MERKGIERQGTDHKNQAIIEYLSQQDSII